MSDQIALYYKNIWLDRRASSAQVTPKRRIIDPPQDLILPHTPAQPQPKNRATSPVRVMDPPHKAAQPQPKRSGFASWHEHKPRHECRGGKLKFAPQF